MPNNEEHAQHSYKRYGVYAKDLHSWMDEPSYIYRNRIHRRFRHDPDHPPMWAIEKYGLETAKNVMLDHIYLDRHEQERYELSVSWNMPGAEPSTPQLHHTLDQIDTTMNRDLINAVKVNLEIITPNGEKVWVAIPDHEFSTYLPKEEFDSKLSERERGNIRPFDDWILAKANQHGWMINSTRAKPSPPTLIDQWIEASISDKLAYTGFCMFLGGGFLLWILPWELQAAPGYISVIGMIMGVIGIILDSMRKSRDKPQAVEHESVEDEEDIDEILEDVILIDDLEEELEDQGYFNDEEHSLSIT